MVIRNNLLKIRLSMGYKYAKEFSELLKINSNQYTRYESNTMQPSSKVLYHICKELSKPIEEILYEV